MRHIPLTKNKVTIVDNDDYIWASKNKWYCSNSGYARRDIRKNKKLKHFLLHRLVANCPSGKQVDHINGDRLDNRKCNLRIVSEDKNHINIKLRCDNKSGYKGVDWRSSRNKWRARISVGNKTYNLGHFISIKDAIKIYNKAALLYHREYRRK